MRITGSSSLEPAALATPPPAYPNRCLICAHQSHCLLFTLPPEVASRLLSSSALMFFERGMTVFQQGDPAKGVLVVRHGSLRLFHLTPGGRSATVRIAGPTSILGIIEVVTGGPSRLSAVTVEDCELELIPRGQFVSALLDHPATAVELLVRVSEELGQAVAKLCETLEKLPLMERLINRLEELAEVCGRPTSGGVELTVPFTVQDLAESVGCSRQWATRLLRELIDQGMLLREGRTLTLRRRSARGESDRLSFSPSGRRARAGSR